MPAEVVARRRRRGRGARCAGRGRLIAARDPVIAARLKAPDPQRVTRALAVLEATGRSLASFQDDGQAGLLDGFAVERMVVDPGRDVLRERIARRFEAMLEQGAVEEVEALRALDLDPSLPAMKAIGVREIADWLDGEIDARGGDRAGGDRDAAVCQAAAHVDPEPDGGLAAGYVTSMTCAAGRALQVGSR